MNSGMLVHMRESLLSALCCPIGDSPGWMWTVALQNAVPAGLTAVTQYEPTLLGLISFISRL